MQHRWLISATASVLCMGLFACSKPAEKTATPAAPAPAPTTSAPAPAANPAPAAAPATAASAAPAASADTVVTKFKANGFSPAWEVLLDGDTVTFVVPETTTPDGKKRTIKVTRDAYAKGANYNGMDGKLAFSLDINGKECTKTGAKREFTATLAYGKSVYKGCADGLR